MNTKVKKVHIIYLNEVLKNKDQNDFKDLKVLCPRGDLVEYHSDLNFQPSLKSVLIFDESDELIFSDPAAFRKFIKKSYCICLTATCAEDSVAGIERSVLQSMNFKIFEHLCDDFDKEAVNPEFQKVKSMENEQLL